MFLLKHLIFFCKYVIDHTMYNYYHVKLRKKERHNFILHGCSKYKRKKKIKKNYLQNNNKENPFLSFPLIFKLLYF